MQLILSNDMAHISTPDDRQDVTLSNVVLMITLQNGSAPVQAAIKMKLIRSLWADADTWQQTYISKETVGFYKQKDRSYNGNNNKPGGLEHLQTLHPVTVDAMIDILVR